MTQYGGVAKLFHQNTDDTFTETDQRRQSTCASAFTTRSWWT